jgi:hypothetical protein
MENTRVLPPLVRPPATSDRCCELAEGFLGSIEHQLLLCHRLSITDQEIEDYVEVSAIALSRYLASLEDAIKRDELIEELSNYTSTVVVAVEAAGIAMERGAHWIWRCMCSRSNNGFDRWRLLRRGSVPALAKDRKRHQLRYEKKKNQ